jgi:hypothetical protein
MTSWTSRRDGDRLGADQSRDPGVTDRKLPSKATTSAAARPTAAKIDRPSLDHDTRRAMDVGSSPKSVI